MPPDLDPIRKAAALFASVPVRQRMCQVMSVAALEQVREGFMQQRDPYDRAWAPLKPQTLLRRRTRKRPRPTRGTQILIDLRRMMGSFSNYAVTPQGFTIRQTLNTAERSVQFAYVHQFGNRAGTIPARPMLPQGTTLPPRWEAAMVRAAEAVLGDALGGMGRVA